MFMHVCGFVCMEGQKNLPCYFLAFVIIRQIMINILAVYIVFYFREELFETISDVTNFELSLLEMSEVDAHYLITAFCSLASAVSEVPTIDQLPNAGGTL